METVHSVVVVGAGAAGLYAAQMLKAQCPDVLVLEAQDRVGGRIRQVHGLAPWPIQAGAEFVHGANSVFVDSLRNSGFDFVEREWPDWWYFAKEKKLVHDEEVDDEVDKVHDMFDKDDMQRLAHPAEDIAASEWMKQQGASERMLAVADACYANDYGCSLSQLGVTEMVEESRGWDCGDTYLLVNRCLSHAVADMTKGVKVITQCPVECVEYGGPQQGVTLHCKKGLKLRAKRVVITVPLPILKEGILKFSPPLPEAKRSAISRVKMGNIIKIILSFKEQFWPENMFDLICTDSFVPEMWMLRYQEVMPGKGHPNIITGFISGEKADIASAMPESTAIASFLGQLDSIFGTPEAPKPATHNLAAGVVYDWSKNDFVKGGYSYPSLGALRGDRESLAAPVAGTVFFAGEATSTALNPCVQGAMDTGRRAATQVLASLQLLPSKL
ncbi:hypothetical protein CEUSTIGMA_g4112.t1 [Chlamydomonas eustigma]|uniref:Amine oxidase domain-containing protein n=1 Tax=Chlamydomonas eustigma TaxID=1157962 RepID=A0A250X0T7_9CHLO|nr:hypothetical protein CEUSTIGMA_g4112.t1 [Chlamydomonas eustigma]|eukprot:GAX76666.1 hypothetical protein CEUSTIGMA_g4112.t1 [Chlamydomonas eustigma]